MLHFIHSFSSHLLKRLISSQQISTLSLKWLVCCGEEQTHDWGETTLFFFQLTYKKQSRLATKNNLWLNQLPTLGHVHSLSTVSNMPMSSRHAPPPTWQLAFLYFCICNFLTHIQKKFTFLQAPPPQYHECGISCGTWRVRSFAALAALPVTLRCIWPSSPCQARLCGLAGRHRFSTERLLSAQFITFCHTHTHTHPVWGTLWIFQSLELKTTSCLHLLQSRPPTWPVVCKGRERTCWSLRGKKMLLICLHVKSTKQK